LSNLISELKRRNVFKVATAYIVVSWLAIQVISSVTEPLGLPDWVPALVIVLLAVGFPIALIFAWAFEMTPDGVKPTSEVDAENAITNVIRSKINLVIIGALVLIIGGMGYERLTFETPSNHEDGAEPGEILPSIAVLPFADMSAAGDQEYFGDGIAEELLNALVRIENIKVTSRTSSFSFKDKRDMSLADIGAALNVDHVLEGSIRTSGNMVRVTAQLIDVRTDKHLWSQTYDRPLDNIFAIQDEISQAIVEALKVELGAQGFAEVKSATTNMEAYRLYLMGRSEFGKRASLQVVALRNAIGLYQQAIALDTNYGEAWAALAQSYMLLNNYGDFTDRHEPIRKAREAVNEALKIDPTNPNAILSSAIIKYQYEADFMGAEEGFEHVIALVPNDPAAYNFYGDYLLSVMDFNRAVEIEKRAYELDPLSVTNQEEYGFALVMAGSVEEGLGIMNKARSDNIEAVHVALALSGTYSLLGRHEEAVENYRQSIERWPDHFFAKSGLLFNLAMTGDTQAREEAIVAYKDIPIFLAHMHFVFGDLDMAAQALDRAYLDGINYFNTTGNSLLDPGTDIQHARILEVLSRPGLKEFMDLRRKNLGLSEGS